MSIKFHQGLNYVCVENTEFNWHHPSAMVVHSSTLCADYNNKNAGIKQRAAMLDEFVDIRHYLSYFLRTKLI